MQNSPFIKLLANHLRAQPPDQVLFKYEGNACFVTLNRPKNHNSINLEMVRALQTELNKWNQTPAIRAVIFKGAGDKAFCAGGDMVRLYKSSMKPETSDYPEIFFREEYTLDNNIAEMKPIQIAFWDGIVMGGGVGVSIHAPIRIATENAVFAMPEARVGLFTDVGGGYFLSRLRNNLGLFLALTATHLKGKELVQVGIADHYVKKENLEKLEQEIIRQTNQNTTLEDLKVIVRKYEEPVERKYANEDIINEMFGKGSVEEIYTALKESKKNQEVTRKLAEMMDILSPFCMKVNFEQIKRGKNLSLRENLKMDMRLMMRFSDVQDCYEGVRCQLLDKGGKPEWTHKSVFEVTREEVEKIFAKLEDHREIL